MSSSFLAPFRHTPSVVPAKYTVVRSSFTRLFTQISFAAMVPRLEPRRTCARSRAWSPTSLRASPSSMTPIPWPSRSFSHRRLPRRVSFPIMSFAPGARLLVLATSPAPIMHLIKHRRDPRPRACARSISSATHDIPALPLSHRACLPSRASGTDAHSRLPGFGKLARPRPSPTTLNCSYVAPLSPMLAHAPCRRTMTSPHEQLNLIELLRLRQVQAL